MLYGKMTVSLDTDNVFTSIELTEDNMAIFGNFKGTTQSEFQIGKRDGNKISTTDYPATANAGDVYIDSSNTSLQLYTGSEWTNIGNTLTELNVDAGTLFVSSANDTVSIGSTDSNERLFVNGSLRLGTNPALKYTGAFLDLQHANGSGSVIRIRDNGNNIDPIFKIYTANNESEAFKVQGGNVTINNSYTLPITDGAPNQALVTDGEGNISFADLGDPVEDYGSITESANVTVDYGGVSDTETRSPTGHDGYTVAEANALTYINPGDMIFVSDEAGGATMAFYDGSNWRRIQDRAVIS